MLSSVVSFDAPGKSKHISNETNRYMEWCEAQYMFDGEAHVRPANLSKHPLPTPFAQTLTQI